MTMARLGQGLGDHGQVGTGSWGPWPGWDRVLVTMARLGQGLGDHGQVGTGSW